jgi:hypothetical protein
VGGVLLAAATANETVKVMHWDLSGYPQWMVVLGGTFALALILWIMMKLLKWTLGILCLVVLVGGIGWAVWLLVQ